MVVLGPPAPFVVQLANLQFLAAAVVQDVLAIRLLLSSAFLCLIVDACMQCQETGVLQVDFLAWGVGIGCVHWFFAYRLATDPSRRRRRPWSGDGAEREALKGGAARIALPSVGGAAAGALPAAGGPAAASSPREF